MKCVHYMNDLIIYYADYRTRIRYITINYVTIRYNIEDHCAHSPLSPFTSRSIADDPLYERSTLRSTPEDC